ncbi:MAG: PilZ domain-containing protein [Candidatus Aenigmarchaeota archaeon]|nr:PilZ domain-containing protein [Candidatus Aenigmarchaeota archaeon]
MSKFKGYTEPERRRYRRLELALPIGIYDCQENRLLDNAFTTDLSTGGAYFRANRKNLNPGDTVNLCIGLPAAVSDDPPLAKITTTGRVKRVDDLTSDDSVAENVGVALEFIEAVRYSYFDLPSF